MWINWVPSILVLYLSTGEAVGEDSKVRESCLCVVTRYVDGTSTMWQRQRRRIRSIFSWTWRHVCVCVCVSIVISPREPEPSLFKLAYVWLRKSLRRCVRVRWCACSSIGTTRHPCRVIAFSSLIGRYFLSLHSFLRFLLANIRWVRHYSLCVRVGCHPWRRFLPFAVEISGFLA